MRIAFVTSEVVPFSKTGGLADVSAALPRALSELGAQVTLFTPLYRTTAQRLAELGIATDIKRLPHTIPIGTQPRTLAYRTCEVDGIHYVFIVEDAFYDRPQLYVDEYGNGYGDGAARFAFFCRAVLEYCLRLEAHPEIFHSNDWQSALLSAYLRTLYRDSPLSAARSVFTIHNIGYQGTFPADHILATGLGWDLFHPEALEFYGKLSLLKGGIIFADAVTTVSPTYAEEIQTIEGGWGLDGLLRANAHKVSGVLNGIDYSLWNPSTDPFLPATYDRDDLAGKATCKRALQERMGLPPRADCMLLGIVSRLDYQKGALLILEGLHRLLDLDLQLVLLGSGERSVEDGCRSLALIHPDSVAVHIGFDDALAHQVEAGADVFLMPSLYEPCGLNQMYSQRYGTIPIVREIGGLKDTVVDFTYERFATGAASGFSFHSFDVDSLLRAVRRAARVYFHDRSTWDALIRHVMRLDHSWARSARQYLRLYEGVSNEP
jgi:starch synthase